MNYMNSISIQRIFSLALFVSCAMCWRAFPQGSAFTYQGRLSAGATPANGQYEMTFTLYDASTNGAVVGTGETVSPVAVSNGLFTVQLDFGGATFDGSARWLEIAVNVFGSDMIPTTLKPRQPITPAPYAIHSANSAGLMTFNNAPLDVKVNGQRVMRYELTGNTPHVIGGSRVNSVGPGLYGATIAGGGTDDAPNRIFGNGAAIGGGQEHTVWPDYATIAGGSANTVEPEAEHAAIGGGYHNRVQYDAEGSVIAGGIYNTIGTNSFFSAIGGGYYNFIQSDSFRSTIGGGASNVMEGKVERSTISGGEGNRISYYANATTIGGGVNNTIEGPTGGSTISGGWGNHIQDEASGATIAGGFHNFVANNAGSSFIGGGESNQVAGSFSVIGGGEDNRISPLEAHYASIGGGGGNEIRSRNATVAGGWINTILSGADASAIGGGVENIISAGSLYSAISGGSGNEVYEDVTGGFIGGGAQNGMGAGSRFGVIGGGWVNVIGPGAHAGTISGGEQNRISANSTNATVAGGLENTAAGTFATVSGGGRNRASGFGAVVAGGGGIHFSDANEDRGNTASGDWSTVGGGADNVASGVFSVVSGGEVNRATGNYGTVPGGLDCVAAGQLSFAAGWGAQALHNGSFVWADNSPSFSGSPLASTTNNQFTARAAGGVRFFTDTNATTGAELTPGSGTWASLSDRNAKENFTAANVREILEKVAALPLATWNYKSQEKSVRHIGPMAQDFRAAFGLGENDRTITTVDADGVALAAIQGLNQKIEAENRELRSELKARDGKLAELQKRLGELEGMLKQIVATRE